MSKYLLASLVFFCFISISTAQNFNSDFREILFKNQFEAIPYDNPELNFLPNARGVFAGDINGDGINDMVGSYDQIAGDERTENLSDFSYKSLVYFGGSTSGEHDQVVYSEITPVGDLNGDGFDDALGFNSDRTISYYFGSTEGYVKGTVDFEESEFPSVTGFRDFNNDGYEDIFFSHSSDRRFRFRIIFGGPSEADFIDQLYMLDFPILFIPAKLDKDVIVALSAPQFSPGDITLITYQINTDDLSLDERSFISLEFEETINQRLALNTMDINNDGLEEIYSPSISIIDGVNTALILNASEEGHTSLQLVETDPSEPSWFIVGDVDNDGSTDFARSFDQSLQISYGQEDMSEGFSVDKEFTFEELIPGYDFPFATSYREFGLGDFNGDGIDDFNILISSESLVGNRVYFGDSDRAHDNPYDIIYNRSDFTNLASLIESVNIGDSNADGFDDLALLYWDRTEIFLGGKFSTNSDITIPSAGFGNFNIETGDFNGDDINDLIIVSNKIDVFFGGSDFADEPDVTLLQSALDPDNLKQGAINVSNAGDFNHDGKDDFIVAFQGVQYFQLFYGGDNISGTADVILDGFDSNFGNENLSTEALSSGYRVEGISDINGDDIDDLAIADLGRVLDIPGTQWTNRGAVFIFYGRQTSEEFDSYQPDDVIVLNEPGFIRYLSFGENLVGGDFNGDGQSDLLISPKGYGRSSDPSNPQQDELIFIYHGGMTFDTAHDQTFELPGNSAKNPELVSFNGISSEIQKLDDINGDGADEIIFSNRDPFIYDARSTRAMLILGGSSISEESLPHAIFTAPNLFSGLGPRTGIPNAEFDFATGDFDGDGIPEAVLQLTNDLNNRNRTVYTFPLENPEKESQSIEFILAEERSIDIESILLEATASSNLPVEFNVVSGPATINDNLLVFSGTGPVEVEASQVGDDIYNRAPLVRKTITVAKLNQTINFNDIPTKTFGDEPFLLEANASSGLELSFSIQSGPASLENNTVTITGAGEIVITASQAGNDNYNEASASTTVSVAKADQTIIFDAIDPKSTQDGPFTPDVTASSGLDILLEVVSGPATINEGVVSLAGTIGTVVLRATQPGNDNYNTATAVEQSFEVTLVTSIENATVLRDINLYPNPTSDQVTISLKNMALHQFKSIHLINTKGEVIKTILLNPNQEEVLLDVSSLSKALYLIQVESVQGTVTMKLLKQN